MQPKAGNLTTAQNQMEIPLENFKKNNVQHKACSRKRVKQDKDEADFFHSQSQKRRRKNPEQNAVAGKESKLKLMHNQLLSPLLNIFSTNPSRMHAFASPPRHQPSTPDYLETTVFETRA